MKYVNCVKCGKKIPLNSEFCPYCGAKQAQSHQKTNKSNENQAKAMTSSSARGTSVLIYILDLIPLIFFSWVNTKSGNSIGVNTTGISTPVLNILYLLSIIAIVAFFFIDIYCWVKMDRKITLGYKILYGVFIFFNLYAGLVGLFFLISMI